MRIKITPDEIIKRCAWDAYVYYILGTDKEAQRILEENEEFEISEKDALVIGLIKVIETDNLIYKFNTYIAEFLANRTKKQNDLLLVSKRAFDIAVDRYMDRFPDYWDPSPRWASSLKDLNEYIDTFRENLEELEIHKVVDRNITFDLYPSNKIKKMLKFNY